MCTFLEACTHGWGAQWATHGECGQGCQRTRLRVARAFPGSAVPLAGMGLWWGDVDDGQCGQGCPRTRPRASRTFHGSAVALKGMGLWWGEVGDGKCGQGCPRTRPHVARAFPGSAVFLAGMGLWWGDVVTENAGKDARGPDLVWRVPSLGAPAPSPAWDCGGVMS